MTADLRRGQDLRHFRLGFSIRDQGENPAAATKISWDDSVPEEVLAVWRRWKSELHLLADKSFARCYFPQGFQKHTLQLHGFCDASELAFAAVIYFRAEDSSGIVHTSLVMSKTRVAPLKRLTIPRLELCGAHLLMQILSHTVKSWAFPSLTFTRGLTAQLSWAGWLVTLIASSPMVGIVYPASRSSFHQTCGDM